MQNIDIWLNLISGSPETKVAKIQSTTAFLHLFSGPTIPRGRCRIAILTGMDTDCPLEASFLSVLGNLTGFRTVILQLLSIKNAFEGGLDLVILPAYKTLDEDLKTKLGGGEAAGWFDELGAYNLTYYPRGRAASKSAASMPNLSDMASGSWYYFS